MGTDKQGGLLSPMEIDAIGEVLNISMGSAATAVSSMLDKQVVITTPNVEVASLGSIDSGRLEPAVLVKITYTEGITGSNVMIYRQRDIQMILNGLMGIDEPPAEDFVFDELSMSAACEVMNQMMGASATALADFLGIPVNISTPEATIMDEQHTFIDAVGLPPEEEIVSILFNLSIKDTMNTEFVSVLSIEFAQELINRFMNDEPLQKILPVCTRADIVSLQQQCREIYIHRELMDYMVSIVHETRKHSKIAGGVSPRGTLAFVRAAQGCAMVNDRKFVTPEDIKRVAVPVLAHRLSMNVSFDAASAAKQAVADILAGTPVPTEDWSK